MPVATAVPWSRGSHISINICNRYSDNVWLVCVVLLIPLGSNNPALAGSCAPDLTQPVTRQNSATRRTVFIIRGNCVARFPGGRPVAAKNTDNRILHSAGGGCAVCFSAQPSQPPPGRQLFIFCCHSQPRDYSVGPPAGQPVVQHCLCSHFYVFLLLITPGTFLHGIIN